METNNNEVLEQNNMEKENVVLNENLQNEDRQNENLENGIKQNDKKNFKVLLVFTLILLLLCGAFVFATQIMKTNEEKFFELFFKKQAMNSFAEEIKDGQIDTNLEIDLNEIMAKFGTTFEDEYKIGLDVSEVIKGKNSSGAIQFALNDDSLLTLEFTKKDDVYGVKVKGATEKFIAIKNKDLKDTLERLGIEDKDQVPDKFLTAEDFEKVIKMKPVDANRILDKYIKVVAKASKGSVEVENNVKMKFGDNEVKTKKYTLSLTEKDLIVVTKELLETLKDDKKNIKLVLDDMRAIIKLMEDNEYLIEGFSSDTIPDVDEYCEKIEKAYNNFIEDTKDYEFDDEKILMEISVYEYKGKTVATEFDGGARFAGIKTLVDKDLYISLVLEENDKEIAEILLKGTMDNNEMDAKFIMKSDGIEVELFRIKQKQTNTTKNFVELNNENVLVINDATEEELKEYAEEFAQGMEKIAKELQEKLPLENLKNNQGGVIEIPDEIVDMPVLEDDILDDDNYEVKENTGVLKDAQDMYNKVQIGDSKENVIQKLGNPVSDEKYAMLEFMIWDSNIAPGMEALEVIIEDGKVTEKSIELYSSKYDGVFLGKETNATIDDLENLISKVKEEMTLAEVENILGKPSYESSIDYEGYIIYTWCDKKDQSVNVSFDNQGKAYYIGNVW